jgi:hypothetical protein
MMGLSPRIIRFKDHFGVIQNRKPFRALISRDSDQSGGIIRDAYSKDNPRIGAAMTKPSPPELTQLLQAWSDGNQEAVNKLTPN